MLSEFFENRQFFLLGGQQVLISPDFLNHKILRKKTSHRPKFLETQKKTTKNKQSNSL